MLLHSRGQSGDRQLTNLNDLLDEYVNLAYHGMRAQDTGFNITIEREYGENVGQVEIVPQDFLGSFSTSLAMHVTRQGSEPMRKGMILNQPLR